MKIVQLHCVFLIVSLSLCFAETSDIWLNANRMNGVFRNNGIWLYDVRLGDWGLEWPKGSGNSPIFAGGQWISGKVIDEIRVATTTHSATEYQAGEISTSGNATDPADEIYRWYCLRSDGSGDWDSWPISQGAPVDNDGNPLLLGDQTIFCVYNDLTEHIMYGSPALGIEVHQTAWSYNTSNLLRDAIFIKWKLINKSTTTITNEYFSIWMDPDLGHGRDDFVGCDSTLNLAFCYNASNNDENYGFNPPAVGTVFLQGSIVDSLGISVQLASGEVLNDTYMLPMTSFVTYHSDDSFFGNPTNATDIWYYQQSLWRNGTPITYGGVGTDPGNPVTKFMHSGDPESGQGWLDGDESDRRFVSSTGPFDLPVWQDSNGNSIPDFGEPGVQEIVIAVLCAQGTNNLNSVTQLKISARTLQYLYRQNFKNSEPPRLPVVETTELSNEILLSWDDRSEYNDDQSPYSSTDAILMAAYGETIVQLLEDNSYRYAEVTDYTYDFYGYKVLQYSDLQGSNPRTVAEWHIDKPGDSIPYTGSRFLRILTNHNEYCGEVGSPLIDGKRYYFGIIAVAFLDCATPQYLESTPNIITAIPQEHPGEQYSSTYGDSLNVIYSQLNSDITIHDGSVTVIVVDPSAVTGHDYEVRFKTDAQNNTSWDLIDITESDTILANQMNQRGDDAYTIVDGLKVIVAGPEPGIKEIVEINPLTSEVYDFDLWGSLNNYGRSKGWPLFIISENSGTDYTRLNRFDLMMSKDYEIIFTDTDSTLAWDYYTNSVLKDANSVPEFIPATFWCIDPNGTHTRLTVCVLDQETDGTWDRTGGTGIFGTPTFDMFYIYDNVEYVPADVATYISTNDGTIAPGYGPLGVINPAVNRFTISMYFDIDGYANADDLDTNGVFYGPPHAGEWIRINTFKPNTANDVFTFTAPDPKTITTASSKADLDKISVVPNPYYGGHTQELNSDRWIQFMNLPPECTIRIFDIAGNLIRCLENTNSSQSLLHWDLRNNYDLPVGSGIYIYYVEVPKIGNKVGKIAVMQANNPISAY